jgi:hypothetical protein
MPKARAFMVSLACPVIIASPAAFHHVHVLVIMPNLFIDLLLLRRFRFQRSENAYPICRPVEVDISLATDAIADWKILALIGVKPEEEDLLSQAFNVSRSARPA